MYKGVDEKGRFRLLSVFLDCSFGLDCLSVDGDVHQDFCALAGMFAGWVEQHRIELC